MNCPKCTKDIGLFAQCGTGYSWYLFRCPYCGQLTAQAKADGYIPEEVLKDPVRLMFGTVTMKGLSFLGTISVYVAIKRSKYLMIIQIGHDYQMYRDLLRR